jgi:hypothetical protein
VDTVATITPTAADEAFWVERQKHDAQLESGGADHDQPYRWGVGATTHWTYPFTADQYDAYLVMKSKYLRGLYADDRAPVQGWESLGAEGR